SAARVSAHHVRSRNDQADRLLPRNRELLAPLFGQTAGAGASYAARLFAGGFADVPRRKSPDDPAAAGHVSRRSFTQRESGEVRIPIAERARQSSPDIRRV